jgi:glutamate/tyrosine decarboxylase-like PLP-dependent enzyme
MSRDEARRLAALFPASQQRNPFADYCRLGIEVLRRLMPDRDLPRVPGKGDVPAATALLDAYGSIGEAPTADPPALLERMVRDFLAGTVNWRCPDTMYNLGAAVNSCTSALYALALDTNVYLINDGLAGNCVLAEAGVARVLASLAGLDAGSAHGLFTFGGTGTVLYGMKMGLRKAIPGSAASGLAPGVRVVITEDAHFSHATAADWLGLGTDAVLTVRADPDRRSSLAHLEQLLRAALAARERVAAIVVNGGTTYDHAIDPIPEIRALRDELVREYALDYVPHLHVDAVIGWAWLTFAGYDFEGNPLGIEASVLGRIRTQYERIRHVVDADSWGVDFHKGAGGCPIDCSLVMVNDRADLARLSKSGSMHQLAEEFSICSPCDYTLETSRAGGKALAALGALHSMGLDGYRTVLSGLVQATRLLRTGIDAQPDMAVLNGYSLGYQSMLRLYAPEQRDDARRGRELTAPDPEMKDFIKDGNAYLKAFFTWDNDARMDVNGGGVVYSFSSRFVTTPSGANISGLKVYPTSPNTQSGHAAAAVAMLCDRKRHFDEHVWRCPAPDRSATSA